MGIEIPDAVKWLTPIVVGADWPEGDETAMRRVAEAWTQAGTDLGEVIQQFDLAAQAAQATMKGETADAFREYAAKFTSGDPQALKELQDLCTALGDGTDSAALEIEYTKMSIIAALIILAAQIAAMIASAVATFGASTAGIPIAQAATQITVRTIFMNLLKNILINMAINLTVDAAIQGIQFATGERESWDGGKTFAAGKSGFMAGLAGGLVDGAAAGIGNKVGKNLLNPTTESFTQAAAYGAGKGAISGALGNTFDKLSSGELPDWKSLSSGATSGGVGGALGGMQSRHEGLDQTWNHNGNGPDWTAGENTQGWRHTSEDGAVSGANVDNPYSQGFNSSQGQHIPGDGGPNNAIDPDDPKVSDATPSDPGELNLPKGPNA